MRGEGFRSQCEGALGAFWMAKEICGIVPKVVLCLGSKVMKKYVVIYISMNIACLCEEYSKRLWAMKLMK